MIPQIARKLLKQYGVEDGWLLDPYCGTGTSLVEASLFGMHSVGCDINPLVRLIATAKSTPICLSTLDETLNRLNDHLFQVEFQEGKVPDARFLTSSIWRIGSLKNPSDISRIYVLGLTR